MINPLSNKFIVSCLVLFFSVNAYSNEYYKVCDVPIAFSPLASWNFLNQESPDRSDPFVEWHGDHGGVVPIPNTQLSGIKFSYKGKGPDGDSSSEFRYTIKQPQAHIYEKFSLYQPENFYHRQIVKITPGEGYDLNRWQSGNIVETNWGDTGKVVKADENYVWIINPTALYDRNWGKGKTIKNLDNGSSFISRDSKFNGSNNKLSAMWQGKYSNAALIVGTTAIPTSKGGENGVGYCELLGSKSRDHSAFKTKLNQVGDNYQKCFDPIDNGSIVDFVIERKRSTNAESADGVYAIWKRTSSSDWQLLFKNESVPAYQNDMNYFDKGYFLGWSNSGFAEDTDFYLLNWSIWDRKPHFLPNAAASQILN